MFIAPRRNLVNCHRNARNAMTADVGPIWAAILLPLLDIVFLSLLPFVAEAELSLYRIRKW
jgi:hypothetical protein